MIPDGNLARYTAKFTDKQIIPWGGTCPVHQNLSPEEVLAAKARHPSAKFAAHPECRESVLALADFVGSTAGIIGYAGKMEGSELIFGTETGILYQLRTRYPGKTFIPASENDDLRNHEADNTRRHPEGPHDHGARGVGARRSAGARQEVSRQDAGRGVMRFAQGDQAAGVGRIAM